MLVSENALKWAMRFYPPLLFQRIWVVNVNKNFTGVTVRISKSIVNINYNRSIFGGTIFSAADPFYAVLFFQQLKRRGLNVRIWLKSASVNYLKPGFTSLHFNLSIEDAVVAEAEQVLRSGEKFIRLFSLEIYDKKGQLCATLMNEVYIKNIA